jgi:hypothetical protein
MTSLVACLVEDSRLSIVYRLPKPGYQETHCTSNAVEFLIILKIRR